MHPSQNQKTFPAVEWLLARNTLLFVYFAVAVLGTVLKLKLPPLESHGFHYPQLQNFAIFHNAFFHLIHGQDLYTTFLPEQWDLFKYSPTFALLMGPIAIFPYNMGAVLWNLLNAMVLFAAVWAVPGESDRKKACVLWLILMSLLVDVQNAQSNGLMAGLMLGSWAAQERDNPLGSSLCIVLSVFIKLFGGLALLPCLLCRGRRKLIAFGAMWMALLVAAPLVIVVSPSQLMQLYHSWYGRLRTDDAINQGLSVMGVLHEWFHVAIPEYIVVGIGAAILLLVLAIRIDAIHEFRFRVLAIASVLIWVIIFNHMAESPAMIIAMTGVGVWYFFQPSTPQNRILLILTFVLTCLSPTDLVPREVRRKVLIGYVEVAPLIVVWMKVQYELLRFPRAAKLPGA